MKTTTKNGGSKKHKKSVPVAAALPPFSNFAGDVPLTIDQICDSLLELTGGWPKCVSQTLCYPAEKGDPRVLQGSTALFAWINGQAPVDWRRGTRAITKEEFFERLHQRECWDWATPHPHFPPLPGVLYLTDPPKAKKTGMLDALVDRFLPKTDKDRQLIKAFVLTLFWGGPPGKRPLFVIAADEGSDQEAGRGIGKSVLPQYIGELVGGCLDVDPSGDHDRIRSDLLSTGCWSRRIALIDNLKTARFSHELFEGLITRTEITGHRLYDGSRARPNFLTWVVTVNGAFFSTDMARRTIVIRLNRPPTTPHNWDTETLEFIRDHREAIIADVRWHLEVKKPATLTKVDSWRSWCLAVLNRLSKPNALLAEIGERRQVIDADKMEVRLALDHLRSCLMSYFDEEENEGDAIHVDNRSVWAPTAWLVQNLRAIKKDFSDRQVQQFLGRLTSSGRLRKSDKNNQRGYLYYGEHVDPGDASSPLTVTYRPYVAGLRR